MLLRLTFRLSTNWVTHLSVGEELRIKLKMSLLGDITHTPTGSTTGKPISPNLTQGTFQPSNFTTKIYLDYDLTTIPGLMKLHNLLDCHQTKHILAMESRTNSYPRQLVVLGTICLVLLYQYISLTWQSVDCPIGWLVIGLLTSVQTATSLRLDVFYRNKLHYNRLIP